MAKPNPTREVEEIFFNGFVAGGKGERKEGNKGTTPSDEL